jgi:transposase
MMVRVLLYGYATVVYSSRKVEAKTYDDAALRSLSADAHPDQDTLAEFRKRPLQALAGFLTQALLRMNRLIQGKKETRKACHDSSRLQSGQSFSVFNPEPLDIFLYKHVFF